jgi:hypothetical protein
MQSHTPLLSIALTLAFLAGCHAGGGSKGPGSGDAPDIIGAWTWTESTGGIAGVTKNPETSGESWSIEFRKDGTYREVRNGEARTGRYSIEERPSIFDHEQRPALVIEGSLERIISRPESDKLVLNDNVYDGFNSVFTKAR